MVFITAVLDNMRPAMSETSLDFRFFCDVNQNLEALPKFSQSMSCRSGGFGL